MLFSSLMKAMKLSLIVSILNPHVWESCLNQNMLRDLDHEISLSGLGTQISQNENMSLLLFLRDLNHEISLSV